MAIASSFKKYGREQRSLIEEAGFIGGMMHTNNTIDPQFLQTIVNMDYDESRGSLVSRPGLRVEQRIDLTESVPNTVRLPGPLPAAIDMYLSTAKRVLSVTKLRAYHIGTMGDDEEEHTVVAESVVEVIITGHTCEGFSQAFEDSETFIGMYPWAGIEAFVKPEGATEFFPARYAPWATWSGRVIDVGEFWWNAWEELFDPEARKGAEYAELFLQPDKHTGGLCACEHDLQLFGVGKEISFTKNQNFIDYTLSLVYWRGHYFFVPFYYSPTLYDVQGGHSRYITRPSLREAVNSGYNMLLEQPYAPYSGVASIFTINGILPYDTEENIALYARTGQTLRCVLYYDYPSTGTEYSAAWSWAVVSEGSDGLAWTPIATTAFTTPAKPEVQFTPPTTALMLRVIITQGATTVATALLPLSGLFNNTGAELKTYELRQATGIVHWQNRVCLYGVPNATQSLFISEVNNPGYFPYPQGMHLFDSAIVRAVPYLDGLLVFTTSRIYLVELSADGLSYTSKVVQNRISISVKDAPLIQLVKNMVFFKTDGLFYMIVPKATSLTGELSLAPISRNIRTLLAEADTRIPELVQTVYAAELQEILKSREQTQEAMHVSCTDPLWNYVDGDTVRNVLYAHIKIDSDSPDDPWEELYPATSILVSVSLNYNTVTRAWTLYMFTEDTGVSSGVFLFEDPVLPKPYQQLSTRNSKLITVNYWPSPDIQLAPSNHTLVLLAFDAEDGVDRAGSGAAKDFGNVVYIDTGYRKQSEAMKKRYREVQFKVYSTKNLPLSFGAAFLLDGRVRRSYTNYESTYQNDVWTIIQSTIPSVATFLQDEVILYNTPKETALGVQQEAVEELNNLFTLDFSAFPTRSPVKVRVPVSGKGYAPRLQIRAFNSAPFELTSINWVARMMNGR